MEKVAQRSAQRGRRTRSVDVADSIERDEVDDDLEEFDDADDVDEYDDYEDDEADAAPPRSLALILTIGGVLGFAGAFILIVERLEMLADSNYMPTCSIDSVLQCSAVMTSEQAALFGFPNPLIGVAAFPLVIASGALAFSRITLPAWFWRWLLAGATFGMIFVGWLISQSLYEIRALCPYCMVVWAVTIPIFWRTLGWSLASGQFGDAVAESAVGRILGRYWWAFMAATYAIVLTLVLTAFPYYFF